MPIRTASLLIVLTVLSCTFASASERKSCAVCGMYMDLYEKTSLVLYFDDGSQKAVCSLSCAARLLGENEGRITKIEAADFLTGRLIDADKAFFLEGSDIPGVMSNTSRIAFSSRSEAEAFRKKHGGRILSFGEALRHQSED